MPLSPLVRARYSTQDDGPYGGEQIQAAVLDLEPYTVPRFEDAAARDAAYALFVQNGGELEVGMTCHTKDDGVRWRYAATGWLPDSATPWQTPGLNATWAALGPATYPAPRYRKLADNRIELNGLLLAGGNGVIFTLPPGFRPARTNVVPALHGDTGVRALFVESTGNLLVAGGTTTTWLSISAVVPLD